MQLTLIATAEIEAAVEEPAEEPTEEPAEEPTKEPAEEPTEEPAEEPTEEPAEEPVEAPEAKEADVPGKSSPIAVFDGYRTVLSFMISGSFLTPILAVTEEEVAAADATPVEDSKEPEPVNVDDVVDAGGEVVEEPAAETAPPEEPAAEPDQDNASPGKSHTVNLRSSFMHTSSVGV
jgi:hypothetical protein